MVLRRPTDQEDKPEYNVKIAVIDSGVAENHPQSHQIKGYKDFVTGKDEERVDKTNHGSMGVDLICKVLEQGCDIYVARVFDKDAGSVEVQDRIAVVCNWLFLSNNSYSSWQAL